MVTLAIRHYSAGNFRETDVICRQILGADPNNATAYHLLGLVAHQIGKLNLALRLIGKAVALLPESAEAQSNFGCVMKELGRFEEAVLCFEKAIALNPKNANARHNLGSVLIELQRYDEAVKSLRKALRLRSDYPEALYCLGRALAAKGALDEASLHLRKAIDLDPMLIDAHCTLVQLKKQTELNDDVVLMQGIHDRDELSAEDRWKLGFSLGKAFEDMRNYEKAFEYYASANAEKRAAFEYSVGDDLARMRDLKKIFSADLFNRFQGSGSPDETPVFVLGMPRSGTTLVEQILASHPEVHGAGELQHFGQVVTDMLGGMRDLTELEMDKFEDAGEEYLRRVRAESPCKRFIVDKMPANFSYIGLIKLMLPEARVVHCLREPLDTCLSIFKKNFADDGQRFAYRLDELGQYYNGYADLMAHWHALLPGFIHDVRYEDLVSDQEGTSRALLDFCGLAWDNACLQFHKNDRYVTTASFAQVRQPVYVDSVQLWRRYESSLAELRAILS